jgi:Uma2 family endonuclease
MNWHKSKEHNMGVITGHQVARRVLTGPRDPAEVLYDWFQSQWWTEELYLALANSENAFVELSEGKVVIYEMPTPRHQSIVGNLYVALRAYGQAGERGKAFVSPMPVRLWRGKFREPNVMFYRAENLERVGEQFGGPPDWVAEITSPSTRDVDILTKAGEYALAGISEYWLIDPGEKVVAVYVLPQGAETYRLAGEYRVGQEVQAQTLQGFNIAVDTLVQT